MSMGRGWLAVGAAGVLGLLAWWLLGSGPPAPPPGVGAAPRAVPAPPSDAPPIPAPAPAEDPAPAASSSPASAPAAPELPPAGPGTILGTVSYAAGSRGPAPGILVVLKSGTDGRGLPDAASAVSGPDGSFRFDGLAPGSWCFSTRTPGSDAWDHVHGAVTLDGAAPGAAVLHVEHPVPEGTGLLVRGTVSFEDGTPVPSFEIGFESGSGLFIAAGTGGRFERRFPGPGTYLVDSVFVEGPAAFAPRGPVVVGEDGAAVVVLRRGRTTFLLVLDAATGEPLPSARAYLWQFEKGSGMSDHHPNARTLAGPPLRADGAGVIDLGVGGPGGGADDFHVVADGHAWRKVTVEFTGGPPVPVLLKAGGDLRLEVLRWPELREARVWLEVAEDAWKDRQELPSPDASGVVRLRGLPEGSWTVVVRSGAPWREGVVYGRGTAVIVPGVEASLVITADPGTATPPVPVTLRISSPAGWGQRQVSVEIEGAEPATASTDHRGRVILPADGSPVSWSPPPLVPGAYHVTVDPNSYHEVVVPPGGGPLDIVLPETVEVRVRVLDADTGKPVAAPEVMWHPDSSVRRSFTLEKAAYGEAEGECVFRAAPGRVVVWAGGEGYLQDDDITLDVAPPGPVRHDARVGKGAVLVVKFRWEGATPLWDDLDIDLDMGNTTHSFWIEEGRGARDGLPAGAATLTVEVPAEEYEAVPDREVELRAGETTEVEIPLVRRTR